MKSSVEIFQTINQALKERIDELMQISEQDGQILQSVLNYVESLPVMNAVRDERTNELAFHVRFHSSRSIHVGALCRRMYNWTCRFVHLMLREDVKGVVGRQEPTG